MRSRNSFYAAFFICSFFTLRAESFNSVRIFTSENADVSSEYRQTYASHSGGLKAEELEKLRGYKLLLIPGYATNIAKTVWKVADITIATPLSNRFASQIEWLRENSLDYERVTTKTQSSIQVNAEIIAGEIRAADKPVIVIGHSKGGLDTLEALIRYPELRDKVKGFIMLQSPVSGSPIAESILNSPFKNKLFTLFLETFEGSRDSLVNLSVKERTVYMVENKNPIKEITSSIPCFSVATWKQPNSAYDDIKNPIAKRFRNEMFALGSANDGLVPVDNAYLPGSEFIKIPGVTHSATVQKMDPEIEDFDRVKFFTTILAMMLGRL